MNEFSSGRMSGLRTASNLLDMRATELHAGGLSSAAVSELRKCAIELRDATVEGQALGGGLAHMASKYTEKAVEVRIKFIIHFDADSPGWPDDAQLGRLALDTVTEKYLTPAGQRAYTWGGWTIPGGDVPNEKKVTLTCTIAVNYHRDEFDGLWPEDEDVIAAAMDTLPDYLTDDGQHFAEVEAKVEELP